MRGSLKHGRRLAFAAFWAALGFTACKKPKSQSSGAGVSAPWTAAVGLEASGLALHLSGAAHQPEGSIQRVELQPLSGLTGDLADSTLQAGAYMPLVASASGPDFALAMMTASGEVCRVASVRFDGTPAAVLCGGVGAP